MLFSRSIFVSAANTTGRSFVSPEGKGGGQGRGGRGGGHSPRSDLLLMRGLGKAISMLLRRLLAACFCSFAIGLFTTLWSEGELEPYKHTVYGIKVQGTYPVTCSVTWYVAGLDLCLSSSLLCGLKESRNCTSIGCRCRG